MSACRGLAAISYLFLLLYRIFLNFMFPFLSVSLYILNDCSSQKAIIYGYMVLIFSFLYPLAVSEIPILTLSSLVCLELILCRSNTRNLISSSPCGYPILLALFVEKSVFTLPCIFDIFTKIQGAVTEWWSCMWILILL